MAPNGWTAFTSENGRTERFFTANSGGGRNFTAEAEALWDAYRRAAPSANAVWLRFHLSDPTNQVPLLRRLLPDAATAVSMVGQAPADGSRIGLEAYHIDGAEPVRDEDDATLVALQTYRLLFFNRHFHAESGSAAQTAAEFHHAGQILARHGGTLENNLQRTWLYCRDIDNNYAGLVSARRELFERHGLRADTHFIASTGIEGSAEAPSRLVRMDSFALFGHRPEQVVYLEAPDHLSPTHIYGVTFERGTRLVFGDRSHYYLSGTASIDRDGLIVHEGNVASQAGRAIENLAALLEHGGAGLGDLKQLLVYLRDPADLAAVETVLAKELPDALPRLIVRGAVCRPGWLVELEGIAINRRGDERFAAFR